MAGKVRHVLSHRFSEGAICRSKCFFTIMRTSYKTISGNSQKSPCKATLLTQDPISWFFQLTQRNFLGTQQKTYESQLLNNIYLFTVFFFLQCYLSIDLILNPLSANFKKWSNTLKQFVGKLPTNRLSVIDHFVGLSLKGLTDSLIIFFVLGNATKWSFCASGIINCSVQYCWDIYCSLLH